MTKQIFISHSSKDEALVQWFSDEFADTGVKPVFMEYKKWSRNRKPNWLWIKSQIEKSKALIVLLTTKIIEKEYTRNWVAFEIGVAAANKSEVPVIVLNDEMVNFTVPFFEQYYERIVTRRYYGSCQRSYVPLRPGVIFVSPATFAPWWLSWNVTLSDYFHT